MTFDETAPCSPNVFKCAGDKKIEENIFVNEELQSFDRDEDEPLLQSASSPELVPAFTLKQILLRLLPLPQQQQRRHELRGRSSPTRKLHLTFRKHIHLNKS
jgi:hypothetical protein